MATLVIAGLTSPKGEFGFELEGALTAEEEEGDTAMGAHLWRLGDLWWSCNSGSKSRGRFSVAHAIVGSGQKQTSL